jgi:hemoglobin/transferrin/lactoferrin receptor protein
MTGVETMDAGAGRRRRSSPGWLLASLALVVGGGASAALAQAEGENEERPPEAEGAAPGVTPLETVTVVGTRTERILSDVPATISVIDSEAIERQVARDIADLVRFEPGVSVGGTGSRFGLGGFTIRGIGGNRVLTTIDGIRVPEEFSFGPFLSARRDFVDIDGLERAEIARGPISSLYGSDALGGVVALQTRKPADYLEGAGPLHLGAKLGYSSPDDSTVGTFTGALGNDTVQGLVLYTRRDARETDNQGRVGGFGPTRELPDPQQIATDNVLGRLAFTPGEAHELIFSVDHFDSSVQTQVFSDYGTESTGTTVDRRDADDSRERTRVSLSYAFTGNLFVADRLQATLYSQQSTTFQLTEEDRTTAAGDVEFRTRESLFEQQIDGGFVQLGKAFELGPSAHELIYGIDYFQTANLSQRDGGTVDENGGVIPEFFPLPTRDFPRTEVRQLAFFVQDEIALLDGRLMLSPGLRFDSFEANAEADELYLAGNPGTPLPEDYADEELTLRFGALYDFTNSVSAYARYSEGFRAPPYDDVNVGFSNFIGGYKTIANPDLQSERSAGVEAGLRLRRDFGTMTITWFRNEYDNFIEPLAIAPQFAGTGGIDPADGLLTFQSINREQVVISGVEATAQVDLGATAQALKGFRLRASVAYAQGEDAQLGTPLNTVDPLTGVFGVGYTAPSQRWGTDMILTMVAAKDENDIDPNLPRPATDGYAVLDLLGRWEATDRISLNAGIFNLLDQTYIVWADTAGIGADAQARFTQPGLNFGANFRVRY